MLNLFQHLILGNQILKPVRQAQGKRVQDDDYLSKGSDITTSFAHHVILRSPDFHRDKFRDEGSLNLFQSCIRKRFFAKFTLSRIEGLRMTTAKLVYSINGG